MALGRDCSVFLATDTALSFEQLWRRHPDVSALYPDESLTICEHEAIVK